MIKVEHREGVSIYGKIIDRKTKRLGLFQVKSNVLGNNNVEYHLLKEAQQRMAALIGIQKDEGMTKELKKPKYGTRN